ncbi:growth/differentiation factor 2 [Nothobranchius furzeri]|uniref:Growth differentiation factor 2 n=1 Tax=Nothobranchius furzeri TaxID=105023 RepID=A0A8C6NZY1_NOTFU|nr:growth/differentiation factor 2 isoform X1 [Nothobranchius furzeri]KAF7204791.1 growth/differentiation factor 2-like [Nothobranchius furzeri]
MKTSSAVWFQLCLTLVVCGDSCTCKPFSNHVQKKELEKFYQQLSEDLLEEEDAESRMESILGTMKEGFLRQLNLSDVPQECSRISPPQFMVELYNKYASNRSVVPQFDVIRSFMVQDILSVSNGTRSKHQLEFNVSIPNHEKIITAELQLLFFPDVRSKVTSQSFKATVKVYGASSNNLTHLLDGKELLVPQSTWSSFDVTTAVQSWMKSGQGVSVFDVVVDTMDCSSSDKVNETHSCLQMSRSAGDNASAALIVFSDDAGSRRRETKKELKEMIFHEEETLLHIEASWSRENQHSNDIPEGPQSRRVKRKATMEYCRRTSLKVNFKDIGWDSWIVAPPEYDAYECRGLCYHPLTDESTPSKHALIQALMNLRDPKKANMACCVPIKLDPITVMYQENGRLTIRYLYEEMQVAECGCR